MNREEIVVWWVLMGGSTASIILAGLLFPYLGWLSLLLSPIITSVPLAYIIQAVLQVMVRNPRVSIEDSISDKTSER